MLNKKDDKSVDAKLKQFYSSSQTYLERLKRHDEKAFAGYIELCKATIPAGASILDCGCGTGLTSYLLSKSGFKVTGMDISQFFLSEGVSKWGKERELEFFVGDASKMPFSNHSFDAVCSFDLVEHVADVRGTLEEMGRVVKGEGLVIVRGPNHLNLIQHLIAAAKRKPENYKYKPWEAKSRIGAFYQAVRTSFLVISKAIGINRKIYYIEPVLSDDEDLCGRDFDATWLTNWFDIENILKELGFSIKEMLPWDLEDRIMRIMRLLRLPRALQALYLKMIVPRVIVVAKRDKK